MPRCFVALGSNIDPETHVPAAVQALQDAFDVTGVSPFYRSTAIGPDGAASGQADFVNGVVRIQAREAPTSMQGHLHRIEARLGRQRSRHKYAPRTIDMDLILWGERVQHAPGPVLPDPTIPSRPFLYVPLRDLEPHLVLPGSGIPLASLPASRLPPVQSLNRRFQAPP